jgi:hypothetical protein
MHRWYPTFVKAFITRWHQRSLAVRSWSSFPAVAACGTGSVAVVGNAGYLRNLAQGHLIDGCDLVIRMNNFEIAGFEPWVGSRVDVFFTNFFTDIRYERSELGGVKHIVASVPNNFRKARRQQIHHRHSEHLVAGLRAMQRTEVFVPGWEEFRELVRQWGSFPSTGMMAVLFALDFLPCARLYITGFSFFQGTAHYFPDQPASARNHDFFRERELFRTLLAPHLASGRVVVDPVMQGLLEFPSALTSADPQAA